MKKNIVLLLLITALAANAQPNFQFTNYLQTPFILNPGATGEEEATKVMLSYRQQWLGVSGAPKVMLASFESHIPGNNGIGAWVSSQKNGTFVDNNLAFSFANRVKFGHAHHLGLGLGFGLNNRTLDYNGLVVDNQTDPSLSSGSVSDYQFNVSAGLFYVNNNFRAGISAPSLYGSRENKLLVSTTAFASYDFHLGEDFVVTPNMLVRTFDNNPAQLDASVAGWWQKTLFSQVIYRSSGNVMIGLGLKAEHFFLSYFFELNNSSLSAISKTSHEFMLSYAFQKQKHKTVE